MQKKEFDNIDLKLKSMLENASVTPSEGVWKSIESRLDPVPAKSWRGAWIWGFGLAGAAAVLALALVVSKPAQEASFKAENTVAIAQDAPVEAVEELASAEEHSEYANTISNEFIGHKAPSVKEVDTTPIAEEEVVVNEEIKQGIKETAAKEAITEASAQIESPAVKPSVKISESEETAPAYTSDPFAALALEDSFREANSRKIRAVASGSLGENIGVTQLSKNSMRAGGLIGQQELKTGIYESGASVYGVPVSFGLGLNIPIKGIFSIDTGIDYSLLTRSFEGVYTEVDALGANTTEGNVLHRMHYIGVPLNLNLNLYQNRIINVYALVGGEIEYCVSNTYTIRGPQSEILFRDPVKAPQFSVKIGAGIEAKLTRHLGLFLDPSARYYFQNNQPKSVRTEKQLLIGINLGLRFDL